MLLDNVANNRSEIARPWHAWARHGNSLFVWSVLYGLACLVVGLALLGTMVWGIALPCFAARTFVPAVLPAVLVLLLLWLAFALIAGYIRRFLVDFIIPLMYRFDLSATEAWRRFLPILKAHAWSFFVYGLFCWMLGMAAGACVLLATIATCCVAGCLMGIPYVGAVVLLPVTVFFRAYGPAYLAQLGREYDVFEAQ